MQSHYRDFKLKVLYLWSVTTNLCSAGNTYLCRFQVERSAFNDAVSVWQYARLNKLLQYDYINSCSMITLVTLAVLLHDLMKAVCSNPNPVPIGRRTFVPSSIALFQSTALLKPHSCLDMSILLLGLARSVNHCRPDDQSFHGR